MTGLVVPCKWVNSYGEQCTRVTRSAVDYCVWHLCAHRLLSLGDPKPLDSGKNYGELLRSYVPFALLVVALTAVSSYALSHLFWLYSGIYVTSDVNYNPHYALVFLGATLIVVGFLSSALRELPIGLGLPVLVSACLSFGLGIFLMGSGEGYREGERESWPVTVSMFLLVIPIIVVGTGLQRKTGTGSIIMVLIGLTCILLAGVFGIVLSSLNYHPWTEPDIAPEAINSWRVIILYDGVGLAAASVDVFLAMFVTGSLVTPFPRKSSRYAWPSARQTEEGSASRLGWILVYGIGVLLVLFGQAALLRYILLTVLGGYPLNFLAWPFDRLIYMAAVVGIHYVLSRHYERADGSAAGDGGNP